MIRFAENLNKMITAGLGGALEAPRTEVAVGYCIRYLEASGPVASFESNIAAPIRNLRVDMHPIQAGSGDPSPENIRPITGWESVTVWREASYDPSADPALTIALGQTVYGGTVDVTTGTMTVDRACFEMQTAKSYDWQKSLYFPGGFYIGRNAFKIDGISLKDTPFLCSHAKPASSLVDYVYGTCYCDSSLNFRLMDESATVSDWVAYLQEQKNNGTPVVACGLLATPLTIQLTPAQLTTLHGQNNVWSDAGDVTLEYPYYEETEGY